jgi:hypothetical protein
MVSHTSHYGVASITRITNHFNEHPRFKEDPRFCGLFERTRGRKRVLAELEDENTVTHNLAPPLQRARHDNSNSNLSTITNTHNLSINQHFPSFQYDGPTVPAPRPIASSSRVMLENLPPSSYQQFFNQFPSRS